MGKFALKSINYIVTITICMNEIKNSGFKYFIN